MEYPVPIKFRALALILAEAVKSTEGVDLVVGKMLEYEQADCPVIHTFGPSMYIREVRLPKGALIIGRTQKYHQMNIFTRGKVLMISEDGTTSELTAPQMFVGSPGRKMGFVLEDVTWLNVYATDETDVETLESTYFEEGIKDQTQRLNDSGYADALIELDITEEEVREQPESVENLIPLPMGSYKIGIFDSNIEGRGVFATADIGFDEVIAPAVIGDKRTPAGRYINHSSDPNTKMVLLGDIVFLVAIEGIPGCKGGQLGAEITTDYRENSKIRSKL